MTVLIKKSDIEVEFVNMKFKVLTSTFNNYCDFMMVLGFIKIRSLEFRFECKYMLKQELM